MTDEQYQELLATCMRKAEREKEEEERMSKTKKNMLVFDTTNLTSPDSDGRPALRVEEIEREAKEEGQPESHMSVALRTGPQLDAASARIAELEARNVELEQRLCIMVERAENREARLKDAEAAKSNAVTAAHALGLARDEHWLRAEKAEADAGRLRAALEMVEWHDNTGNGSKRSLFRQCAWCLKFKRDGLSRNTHAPDCARQVALSPAEKADDEKGVKG